MLNKNLNATYNNVVDALKCVAFSHGMVNNVSSGTVDEVDISANSVYPLVHIVPGNVTAGIQQLTFEFNILAMDLSLGNREDVKDVKKSLDLYPGHEQQILSDTMQILIDIIAQYKNGLMLRNNRDEGILGQADDKDFILEPFTERFDNVVSGWNCSFSITVPGTYFACESFNWSANYNQLTGDWIFSDGGTIACSEFSNNPKEDSPVVMPIKETIVP